MQQFDALKDLFHHMEWADATVWRAVLALPDTATDSEQAAKLRELCHHIPLVQDAFLKIWTHAEMVHPELSTFDGPAAVCAWHREYYPRLRAFLETVSEEDLETPYHLPWAERFARRVGKAPEPTTLGEMMTQVTQHSTHHRGQVTARLRALGGEPPLVDYIAWIWYGRPRAEWPD